MTRCPLKFAGWLAAGNPTLGNYEDTLCDEGGCAWWNRDRDACALFVLSETQQKREAE